MLCNGVLTSNCFGGKKLWRSCNSSILILFPFLGLFAFFLQVLVSNFQSFPYFYFLICHCIKFCLIVLFSAYLLDNLTPLVLVIFFSIIYMFYNRAAFLSHIYSFLVIFVYFATVNSFSFGISGAGCFYLAPGLIWFSDKFNTVWIEFYSIYAVYSGVYY